MSEILAPDRKIEEGALLEGTKRTCYACSYAGMEPDSPTLICGHPDTGNGGWGLYIRKEPLDHCPDLREVQAASGEESGRVAQEVELSILVKPIEFVDEASRESLVSYDARRVRYFIERLRAGLPIDPISVESRAYQYRVCSPVGWGPPYVDDGHHRFVAAVLTKTERIPATFGGLVTTINWLTGKRNTLPPELR